MSTGRLVRRFAHLRAAGSGLLLCLDDRGRLTVDAWGADVGRLEAEEVQAVHDALARQRTHSSIDEPRLDELVPQTQAAYAGRPGVTGHADGSGAPPCFAEFELEAGSRQAEARARDPDTGVELRCRLEITATGVLLLDYRLTNAGPLPFTVGSVLPSLVVPARATELLDLTGRWARERVPQRRPFHPGAWVRESRHGRPGHDAPLLLVAGTPAFGFASGEVWAIHVAWSGNQVSYAEATAEGDRRLGGGELLIGPEVVLKPGDRYDAPTLVAAWSGEGLDGLSERLHGYVRDLPHLHGRPRPVVLNTWEAVYFDQDLETLRRLADAAAEVGVERFVLDDGWSQGRTDDRRGLGDWRVDAERWRSGLHPLVDHVRSLGMQFGLWVEPEMVNQDSEVARAHPQWLLAAGDRLPLPWRHQQVLDLQQPAAYASVRDALLALLAEYDVSVLKWDHNRDIFDGLHGGRAAVHGQTLAVYRMLDELRELHPGLEVESSASGGARIDLGMLRRAERVWASDTQDALERLSIQRWTTLLVPPEVVGSHVGAPTSHTTGRTLPLAFRASAALLGHFGIEWNLLDASAADRRALAQWVALHQQLRALVSTGRLVRADDDAALMVTGVVAPDRRTAYFVLSQVAAADTSSPAPVLLRGLDPELDYVVERVDPPSPEPTVALGEWVLDRRPLRLGGASLMQTGVRPPVLAPYTARVLRLRATG